MKFEVEVDEYLDVECGHPCTPDGCPGHSTDIPLTFCIVGTDIILASPWLDEYPTKEELEEWRKLCHERV